MLCHQHLFWLFTAWPLLICSESVNSCPLKDIAVYNRAMRGYDPTLTNIFQDLDPGIRGKIFEFTGVVSDGVLQKNSFIDEAVEKVNCNAQFTEMTIKKYMEYRHVMTSAYTFASDAEVNLEGHGIEKNTIEKNILKFFLQNKGEIVQIEVSCITNEISIAPFGSPIFTEAFSSALKELHIATKYPILESSKKTLSDFVIAYGTHFSRRTQLGSKIIFQKMFTSNELDYNDELLRRKCVSEAALASIKNGATYTSAFTSFSMESRKCEDLAQDLKFFEYNGISSARVIVIGKLSSENLDKWSETVKNSPVPVNFVLEKISLLFSLDNDIDGVEMRKFFEPMLSQSHSDTTISKEVICSLCPAGSSCTDNQDHHLGYSCTARPVNYGGVFISGGEDGSNRLSEVDALDTWQPPSLPVHVLGSSLSIVDTKIYSCGGREKRGGAIDLCYKWDRSSYSTEWTLLEQQLPTQMDYHSAVEIANGRHIWIVFENYLYDLDTTDESFRTYGLPFSVSSGHCAVSNPTHCYIIGAGEKQDEIWVNSRSSTPAQWKQIDGKLSSGRSEHACLWFKNSVFITGGIIDDDSSGSVEVFDIETNTVNETGTLIYERRQHGMMVLDGKPAVVGGYQDQGKNELDNIETYDNGVWNNSSRKLLKKRFGFALAQLHD